MPASATPEPDTAKRRPTVAQQITPAQLEELVQWAWEEGRISPKKGKPTIHGGQLHEKLVEMGVDCTLDTVYHFRLLHVTPALESLMEARAVARELEQFSGDGSKIAQGTGLVLQQLAFGRALELKSQGRNLKDPKVREEVLDLMNLAKTGSKMVDDAALSAARVEQLRTELEALKAELQRERDAIDKATARTTPGMTTAARNALRRELGLADVTEP